MSGKPASVAAPRAGVAGAPRLLVYVAEARQLEAAAAGPDLPPLSHPPLDALYLHDNLPQQLSLSKSTLYRSQSDVSEQRNAQGGLVYKPFNDTDNRLSTYGISDSLLTPTNDVYSQPFLKEPCLRSDNNVSDRSSTVALKRECGRSEWDRGDTYNVGIQESRDLDTYQNRCLRNSDNNMPTALPVVANPSSQYTESAAVQSDGEGVNCNDRELSVNKSFVNYQLLEQSESHQSIVNQSINILNQQVGVSRSLVSEGVGSAPQLVRTAEGVVLAVLPSSALPLPNETPELRAVQSEPQTITVPLGWRRIVNGASVAYISPSGTVLSTLAQLRDYLQTAGTCKCGLPCPLRPETAFNFDPKVVSKPYQAASSAESTRLCNHKRKLLATIQSKAQSPATSPPPTLEQKKGVGAETVKKKMKKRPGFAPNMSVSQMMVQRERPHNEFKNESEQKQTGSSGIMLQRAGNLQQGGPFTQQNTISKQDDIKQETQVQRGSHYLTVNSGWITQHPENIETGKTHSSGSGLMNALNVGGLPVLGTNGQIIGVNTGYNRHSAHKNTTAQPHSVDSDNKAEEKEMIQSHKSTVKDEEPQIFCGLNQPLTPEVMKKINEQQQIFIQRNQKQIEVMKGYKAQMTDSYNQNKSQAHNQFPAQGQLVIHNGAVVKTSSAKTPPWQVKRNDLICPSPKQLRTEGECEDNITNTADDNGAMVSFTNNDQSGQGVCSRVPPLPQHYSVLGQGQQWPNNDVAKKKKGNSKSSKKKATATTDKFVFSNNSVRYLQDGKTKSCDDMISNNVPSFMDDPNGYLAQQTVLLNNTISRQVGLNPSYEGNHADNTYSPMNHSDKTKSFTKVNETLNSFRNNMISNPSPSPNNTPDSSLASEKCLEKSNQCCKGCNISFKGHCSDNNEHQLGHKYMKPQTMYNVESDTGVLGMSSPKGLFEENPVTSSTFIDRNIMMNEHCGPIQAGIVSTSNVSPETLQQPEPSPTLSNSSRSTDTPHSSQGNNSQMQNNSTFSMPSPLFPGSGRDHFNSNPPTPGNNQVYPYNSPGPANAPPMCGTQMMHFISNHNVNKNLMEVDNISMVGVRPALKNQDVLRMESKKGMENNMPGYCPPPHLGGGPAHSLIQAYYVQTFVTTMASGFSVTRDTVTSVLAGKANTATTSINSSQANFVRPPPPPSINLATTYAIPNNQPDPFINSVNLPTSYPLHIAGTTAQNMISKSPLEMVQSVISSLPSKPETSVTQTSIPQRRTCSTPGQILISSTGQIIVSNNHMPPPPPKNINAISPISSCSTNVTTSVTHVVPAVGGVQPLVNQQTVVVNTLPAPFVIQPPMMTVDGQVVQQNTVLPQMVAGGLLAGQHPNDSSRQIEVKNGQSFVQGVAMLSPESIKKRSKKKKNATTTNITNVLQITAPQQTPNNIMMHHTSPQHNSNPQFSPRGFQLSPTNNISPTPMLQALTIVPGKSGTPAHIVMNGQAGTSSFGSQQIITNTSPSQPINLLQPVNLINNANSMMSNFPFQQFILPNLGGMVMTADGTTIIQDNSTGMPMQLQLQTVNGQNVLTPVQNPSVFSGTNSGVVIRAQNQPGKIIQSQHSPGAQFLSPNSQVMVNSPNFNGQLSPLLANLSPTSVTFNTSPHQVRSGNVQTQEFIQTNQMGQTLMVPLSPKQVSATGNRNNSTFVQQNTTIVQQQTTLVSNSQNTQMSSISSNLQGGNSSRMSIDHNLVVHKPVSNQKRNFVQISQESNQIIETKEERREHQMLPFNHANETEEKVDNSEGYVKFMNEFNPLMDQGMNSHVRHSVSTQTLVNQQRGKSPNSQAVSGSSPPDTTTHSPLGALETAASPRLYGTRCMSTQGNYADTTTKSPEPTDVNSSGMVQCVSSSEQDIAESRERTWSTPRGDVNSDAEAQNMMSNIQLMRLNRTRMPVESTEMQYNQNMSSSSGHNMLPMACSLYERHGYKRKNDFGDGSTYRTDKIMRTNYGMVHCLPKTNYEALGNPQEKHQMRNFSTAGNSSDMSTHKAFERHLGSRDDSKSEDDSDKSPDNEKPMSKFHIGDLVWGPVKGYASWPGKLEGRCEDGKWSVRWFGGDRASSAVDDARLLTLSEGLEAHHAARTKHRKSRKLNTLLENAIQEAMSELDKKSERATEKSSDDSSYCQDIIDNPRRRKQEKRSKLYKKSSSKLDGSRLRSSR